MLYNYLRLLPKPNILQKQSRTNSNNNDHDSIMWQQVWQGSGFITAQLHCFHTKNTVFMIFHMQQLIKPTRKIKNPT